MDLSLVSLTSQLNTQFHANTQTFQVAYTTAPWIQHHHDGDRPSFKPSPYYQASFPPNLQDSRPSYLLRSWCSSWIWSAKRTILIPLLACVGCFTIGSPSCCPRTLPQPKLWGAATSVPRRSLLASPPGHKGGRRKKTLGAAEGNPPLPGLNLPLPAARALNYKPAPYPV